MTKNTSLKGFLREKFFYDQTLEKRIESPIFDLSQEIMELESLNHLTQKQAADYLQIDIKTFVLHEMGELSFTEASYEQIIQKLKKYGSFSISIAGLKHNKIFGTEPKISGYKASETKSFWDETFLSQKSVFSSKHERLDWVFTPEVVSHILNNKNKYKSSAIAGVNING